MLHSAGRFGGDRTRFGLEDPKKIEAEARILAVKDAREKAEGIAAALGEKLGRAATVSEQGGLQPAPYYGARMALASANDEGGPTIAAGEIVVKSSVSAGFELL